MRRSRKEANPTQAVDFRAHPAVPLLCHGSGTIRSSLHTVRGGTHVVVSQEEHLKELSKGYRFDWKDADHSVFEPKRGLNERVVEEISRAEERARVDAEDPAEGACATSTCVRCRGGAPTCPTSTSRTSSTSSAPPRSRPSNWDDLPDDIKGTWDKLGIPEAEKKYLGGVSAQYESEVVYHKIKKELDDIGVLFTDMDSALRDYPDLVQGALRHGDPAQRQQVRGAQHRGVVGRVVHLRAAGRAGRHPAAGVLPDQRREHGPVRAHADHRRRGQLRALRRGLLGADLLERLAALGGRRDQGDEGRARPLHDDPELVDERLQPGDQARGRRTRTPSWSGSTATSAPRSR